MSPRIIALLCILLSLFCTAAPAGLAAADNDKDWLPTGSIWEGLYYLRDQKGKETNRARFAMSITSRDRGRFVAEGFTPEGGGNQNGRYQVEGVITASNHINLKFVKILRGQPMQALLDHQFSGRISDQGRRLTVEAVGASGGSLTIDLTRSDESKK